MFGYLRGYATKAVRATKLTNASMKKTKRRRRLEEDVSFEDFVLRQQVLQTYRDMLRTVSKIPDPVARAEIKGYLVGEFKAVKNVQDMQVKRSLLIGGIREFRSMSNNLGLSLPEIDFTNSST